MYIFFLRSKTATYRAKRQVHAVAVDVDIYYIGCMCVIFNGAPATATPPRHVIAFPNVLFEMSIYITIIIIILSYCKVVPPS